MSEAIDKLMNQNTAEIKAELKKINTIIVDINSELERLGKQSSNHKDILRLVHLKEKWQQIQNGLRYSLEV